MCCRVPASTAIAIYCHSLVFRVYRVEDRADRADRVEDRADRADRVDRVEDRADWAGLW